MFDWLTDLGETITDAIFGALGEAAQLLFSMILSKIYESIYQAVGHVFTYLGNMGAEIFDLLWVQALVRLFHLFGWSLFVVGVVVSVFELAVAYQSGRGSISFTVLQILKSFFVCMLINTVPVELFRFCVSLHASFTSEVSGVASLTQCFDDILNSNSFLEPESTNLVFLLVVLLVFAYCIVRIFFQNISRGGILLIQICVGELHIFGYTRGYTEGFATWCRQVVAICFTAFMQTTMLYLGLLSFNANLLMGLGLLIAAAEVPRIAQQFGLDCTVHHAGQSLRHAATTVAMQKITQKVGKK